MGHRLVLLGLLVLQLPATLSCGPSDRPTLRIGSVSMLERRIHVGDLGGKRMLLAWTSESWDHEDLFAQLLAIGTRDSRPLVALDFLESPEHVRQAVFERGGDPSALDFISVPLDTFWVRDFGPQIVRDGSDWRIVDFPYGTDRPADDVLPVHIATYLGLPIEHTTLDVEGGHLLTDGYGSCIITEDAVYRTRESGRSDHQLRSELERLLGCTSLVVVPELLGEGTGHVDVMAMVTGRRRVLVGSYVVDEDPENAHRLDDAAALLREAGWTVQRVGMPDNSDREVFRTYLNALVLPDVVLVPSFEFDDRFEDEAIALIASELSTRTVIPLPAESLARLDGALHCAAMMLPL